MVASCAAPKTAIWAMLEYDHSKRLRTSSLDCSDLVTSVNVTVIAAAGYRGAKGRERVSESPQASGVRRGEREDAHKR